MWKFLKTKLLGEARVVGSAMYLNNGHWNPKQFLFIPTHPAVQMTWRVNTLIQSRLFRSDRVFEEMCIQLKFANHEQFGMPAYLPFDVRLKVRQIDGIYVPEHHTLWERAEELIRVIQAYYYDDLVEYELDSPAGYPPELIAAMDKVTNTYPPSSVNYPE